MLLCFLVALDSGQLDMSVLLNYFDVTITVLCKGQILLPRPHAGLFCTVS